MTTGIGRAPASRISRRITRDVTNLPAAEIDALSARLYPVHCQAFAGVPEAEFRENVLEPPAERSVVQMYLDAHERIVGYCALHRFRRQVGGRDVIVLRIEAGLHPDHRRGAGTVWFVVRRLVAARLRFPFTPIYLLGNLVHPSGYHILCKYFPRVVPRADREAAPGMTALALELADSFPEGPVSDADPFIRKARWVTIEPDDDYLAGSTARQARGHVSRHVLFFEQRNPGYRKGDGLVVMVPLTFGNVARGALAVIVERIGVALGVQRRHGVDRQKAGAGSRSP